MRIYQIISGDGHIEGPVELAPYLPEKYAGLAPQLVERPDGTWIWSCDWEGNHMQSLVGSNVYSGLRYDQFTAANACTYWNPDGSLRPGASSDPAVRLGEQDRDGIDAEVLFFPMGAGMMIGAAGGDRDAHLAAVRAYTDFLADYCAVAPDRLIGTMLLPHTGVDDILAEIEYGKGRGLHAVCLQNWPNGNEPTPDDDRFWEAVLDLGMTVSPHISFGSGQVPPVEIHVTPQRAMGGFNQYANPRTTMPIAQLIHAGVFDRFPALKIYFAESEVSWLAGWLEYIDEFYSRWAPFHGLELAKMPSDYVRDHCRFCMISDRMAVPLRNYIGTELFLWGSDFPHSVGTFPDTQYILDEFFEGVPDDERRQILVQNPCDLFGLDPDHELTPTP
jgi:predicted TIM-barrel fold metal-dependent hydrolase